MARIEIQRLKWIQPPRMKAEDFERAKAYIGRRKFDSFEFLELHSLLHGESFNHKELLIGILKEAGIYLGTILFVSLIAESGVVEWFFDLPFGDWEFLKLIIGIPGFFIIIMSLGFGLRFVIQCLTYWPSILFYIARNKRFIRKRFNAVQLALDYEDYLDREI